MARNRYYSGRQIIDITDFGSIDFDERILICVPRFAWIVARSYLSVQAQWESSYATEYFSNGYEGPSAAQLDVIKANVADFLAEVDMSCNLFGGIVEEGLSDTDLPAGNSSLVGAPVPAGEIHVITIMSILYSGTTPALIQIIASGLGGNIVPMSEETPSNNLWYSAKGELYLQEGDSMTGNVQGATAGDELYFRYAGYKFDAP